MYKDTRHVSSSKRIQPILGSSEFAPATPRRPRKT